MGLVVAFLQLCVALLALPVHILNLLGLWEPLSRRYFPHLMSKLAVLYDLRMNGCKRDHFSTLPEFAGASGHLRLLELGCGTGANFQFYPKGTKVICTDRNPNFEQYLKKSQAENDHLLYERHLVAPAEDLTEVQDASVDVVVCTLVLCSVKSVEVALNEVLRILRPGGAFYFLEHVSADPSTWFSFFQQIYDPTWKCLLDGCNLSRETWKQLEKASFSELKLRHIWAPFPWNPVRPHVLGTYVGAARRPYLHLSPAVQPKAAVPCCECSASQF